MSKSFYSTLKVLFVVFSICLMPSTDDPTNYRPHSYDTDDQTFYDGEILLPDMVHDDTLIVTNAELLNEYIGSEDIGSDGDINDLLKEGTVKFTNDR